MDGAELIVDIDGLSCRAGARAGAPAGARELLALPRLQVRAGERVAIIGPNGAGKTTLLRCLSGFVPTAAGRVIVNGHRLHETLPRVERRALRREVGQVLQGLHLVGRLTAVENVLIGALGRLQGRAAWRSWLRWYPPAEVTAARAALASVGLAGRESERADRLSGGERQKVAIARLLLQRPRLILADEPTASLDPAAALDVCEALLHAARGATLVSVVHEMALLPQLAERVIGLKHGRLWFDLPLAQVDEARLQALFGSEPRAPTEAQVQAQVHAQALGEASAPPGPLAPATTFAN